MGENGPVHVAAGSREENAMIKANGIHHIAIMAADIREHIAFFSDVMGFQLSALFDMHGVPGGGACLPAHG